jgi:hypothetical protein
LEVESIYPEQVLLSSPATFPYTGGVCMSSQPDNKSNNPRKSAETIELFLEINNKTQTLGRYSQDELNEIYKNLTPFRYPDRVEEAKTASLLEKIENNETTLYSYTPTSDLPGIGIRKGEKVWFRFGQEPKIDDMIIYSTEDGNSVQIGQFQLWDWDGMLVLCGDGRLHFVRPRTMAVIVEIERPWVLPKSTFYHGE